MKKKTIKRTSKRLGIKILVINLRNNMKRWKKYEKDDRYERFNATLGSNLGENNKYMKKIIMMWNVSDKQKRNVVGCLISHLRVLRYIVKNKLKDVLIIEDDAIVDFKKLKRLKIKKLPRDKMIYFGGIVRSLKLNDSLWSYNNTIKTFKIGLNKINPKKFKIGATHGYFIPEWGVAKRILKYIDNKERLRAIDGEFALMQRDRIDLVDSFIYPAIVYLKMDEALDGFSSKYGIPRDMRNY